jgi:hypothetical protein
MGSEEQQRETREQGSRPTDTETQEQASSDREELARSDAERRGAQRRSPGEPAPLPQEEADRPTPRR